MNLNVRGQAAITGPLEVFVLILPLGMAVPSLTTPALIKASERFIWLRGQCRSAVGESATAPWQNFEAAPRTKRRYEMNDRIAVAVINRSGIAFGAAALECLVMDLYATED
ncbi:MAG: hypothetical protein WAW96_13565 [Alphaproteobacteria bacterium]